MIDGQKCFDQSVKNDLKTFKKFKKLQLVKEMMTQLVLY